jgi:hypothetical protein
MSFIFGGVVGNAVVMSRKAVGTLLGVQGSTVGK